MAWFDVIPDHFAVIRSVLLEMAVRFFERFLDGRVFSSKKDKLF